MDNNTNTTIKDAVLDRISAENVTPKSKWYFLARHAALWTPGAAVTVLGGFAMASILFSMFIPGKRCHKFTIVIKKKHAVFV